MLDQRERRQKTKVSMMFDAVNVNILETRSSFDSEIIRSLSISATCY